MNRKERRATAKKKTKIVEAVRLEDEQGEGRWVPAHEVTDEQWAASGFQRDPKTGEITLLTKH